MYSSRGTGAYGQSYTGQSTYGQNLSANYSGSSVGGHDVGQHSAASRHSTILSGSQEVDVGGYRAHTSTATQYGGQYSSVYGSAALSSAQQVPSLSTKGAASSALDGRGGYTLGVSDSPKFASGDYVSSSSHGYGHKSDQLYGDKTLDYSGIDRRQYGERQSGYIGRDLPSDPTARYAADAVGFTHQHQQAEIYDRIDQAALLRQEQLLKAQSLQATSLDGGTRQADYLAARAAASRHPTQDLMSYGGRMDSDPRASSMLSATSYSGQHAPSILGAAPRRNVDELLYSQNSSNPGYGVSLPPGRDYASGKGLHGNAMELDYPANLLQHAAGKGEGARAQRALETRHERTPVRSSKDPRGTSKDPRGSSLTKEGRSTRRDSPHHGAVHRHHSPVKEKRREYVCKVYPSCLVDIERDYLSIDKRYPRLFVCPEFSKAVVKWPKENLKMSIHTPVSFEHDFIEENATEPRDSSSKLLMGRPPSSEQGNTVWNAKIILMSGLSRTALEELSSEKIFDDRIPHICNFLRFAVLKKDHSFMAVGGPWEPADGGDPSNDDSSLIRTALRYAKDVIQLDLQNCQHWNRFLEIHYDRVGKDGFFSHKEITVLYVPNLSDCLPSLDGWRDQWLAHKKAVAEREHQLSLKKEKSRDNKEASKDKSDKRKDSAASGQSEDVKKKEKDSNTVKEENENKTGVVNNKIAKNDASDIGEGKDTEKKPGGNATGQTTSSVKSVKRKVIKKVVKQKVAVKANDTANKQVDKSVEKDVAEKVAASNVPDQEGKSSLDPTGVQTSGKDLITEDVSVGKTDGEDGKDKGINSLEDKPQDKPDPMANAVTNAAAVKTIKKKKIIKRVPKKKVVGEASKSVVSDPKNEENDVAVQAQDGTPSTVKQTVDATLTEAKKPVKVVPKKKIKTPTSAKQDDVADPNKTETNSDKKEEGNVVAVQAQDGTPSTGKQTAGADTKVTTEVKKSEKVAPKKKLKAPTSEKQDGAADSNKTVVKSDKDDKKDEKGTGEKSGAKIDKQKASEKDIHNLRSLSLSLDSLLDYTDKDVEESTLELSLFAESFNEMLQFQMGSRILTFLQKLRVKFVTKRAQRKRQREDEPEKDNVNKSPVKRAKGDDTSVKSESTNMDASNPTDNEKAVAENDNSSDKEDDVKMEDETEEEEDPEEDPEEDEEMENGSPQHDSSNDKKAEQEVNANIESENISSNEKAADETSKGEIKVKDEVKESKADVQLNEEKEGKVDKSKKETPAAKEVVVDKELLQAFRFFDRNRAGYIRVEDMRLIIHSLGMFLSHRDVKHSNALFLKQELVQSALLESNTGRDDRILYNKVNKVALE
ncbi:EF-hand domain [Sesbania bispinosa]|nr:EF-hand domain [Sesbania bispinosa]